MARSPSRVPGAVGAKVMVAEQLVPPANIEEQLVVSMKSPVRIRLRENADTPVFAMFIVCVVLERAVTGTGVVNVTLVGVTTRFGLTLLPFVPGCGRVWPVTSTERPVSSESVMESSLVLADELYPIRIGQMLWGRSVPGHRSLTVKAEEEGTLTALWGIDVSELFERNRDRPLRSPPAN